MIIKEVGPLMNTRWAQDAPFNQFCPVKGGRHADVGCVPLCIGEILHYFDSSENDIARMLADLGEQCHTWYTRHFSFTLPWAAVRCLRQSGFQNVKIHWGFNQNLIIGMLDKGNPVMMMGISGLMNGHAWIIDGYRVIELKSLSSSGGRHIVYFHCDWGWGGQSNGLYRSCVFNPHRGAAVFDPSRITSGIHHNGGHYCWHFRSITYEFTGRCAHEATMPQSGL